jgi:hypothetical protein
MNRSLVVDEMVFPFESFVANVAGESSEKKIGKKLTIKIVKKNDLN